MVMTKSSKNTTGEKVTTSNMIEKSKANSIPVEDTILPATTNTSHTRENITASTTKMEKTTSISLEKEGKMITSVVSKTTNLPSTKTSRATATTMTSTTEKAITTSKAAEKTNSESIKTRSDTPTTQTKMITTNIANSAKDSTIDVNVITTTKDAITTSIEDENDDIVTIKDITQQTFSASTTSTSMMVCKRESTKPSKMSFWMTS